MKRIFCQQFGISGKLYSDSSESKLFFWYYLLAFKNMNYSGILTLQYYGKNKLNLFDFYSVQKEI